MHEDARKIIKQTIADVMPDRAVRNSLNELQLNGNIYIIAIGKAAWVMAQTASAFLNDKVKMGLIVTKYGHSRGPLKMFEIIEAGHPTPDENSIRGAKRMLEILESLEQKDIVLFLLSGGGSSLVELPMDGLDLEDIQTVTRKLLFCGADITEMNLIRKKLSAIKGGKLSGHLRGQKAYAIILSDIISDNNDMIASGITYPDLSTVKDVEKILKKYQIRFDRKVMSVLEKSDSYRNVSVENHVVGSVTELCKAAAEHAWELGYIPHIVTTAMDCEAREAGRWMASMAEGTYPRPFAMIAGGETVVKVTGKGMGGRNQEIALSAAMELKGKENVLLFSLGSDGTDGPTDAAGGMVDGHTAGQLEALGINIEQVLADNDSYHALKKVDGLIITGATGTNVNDVTVLLCK
ncbi:MAG TPA: glycerate kinase [Candidatus Fusicatenibacter intestinigallinarum]|uniref:Glycerate kinase n=1 Tax=Candidatus Fusicatenibacter intestinigallinarum TaxID=2838598 RepID=A0A9D2N993_9FIRM|nr:glycerate kinase [Candidatus Fusicatenibacter intestinigallinarum]